MSREMWIVLGIALLIVAIITVFFAVKLGARVLATRRMLGELGMGGKIAFYGSLIYTFFPIDLLPDPIYLDDIGILAIALTYLTNLVRKRRGRVPAQANKGPDVDMTTGRRR